MGVSTLAGGVFVMQALIAKRPVNKPMSTDVRFHIMLRSCPDSIGSCCTEPGENGAWRLLRQREVNAGYLPDPSPPLPHGAKPALLSLSDMYA